MPVQVLAVLPGNTAVVSTDRLFRVVAGDSRTVVEEFLDVHQAAAAVSLLRRSGQLAEAVPYAAAAIPEWTDAERIKYDDGTSQVLAILPRCAVVSTVGRYQVTDRRCGDVYHDFCDADMAEAMARKQYVARDGSKTELFVESYDSVPVGAVSYPARPAALVEGAAQ